MKIRIEHHYVDNLMFKAQRQFQTLKTCLRKTLVKIMMNMYVIVTTFLQPHIPVSHSDEPSMQI